MTLGQARIAGWSIVIVFVLFWGFYGWLIYRAVTDERQEEKRKASEAASISREQAWGVEKLDWCKKVCPSRTDAGYTSDGRCICVAWPIPCPVVGEEVNEWPTHLE